ncbi:MAG TPA: hypothetical protein VH092_26505 [Urbifossiella sp.]|jgi:hypothetical protein|nr:hypothetical protein [Urbifossiella sp.]
MRRSGRSGAVLLVLAGVFVVAVARPAAWRGHAAAGDRIDAIRRQTDERIAFNRQITVELAARRIGLADAADRLVDANTDRPGYFNSLQATFPAPTDRECQARSLIYRVEHPSATEWVEHPAVRAEYAALFGHPYVPPCP